ncbi:MAG: sigma factor-like helix-turn-helix DNA-binding protein [Candidatus Sumerlaeia bacterium]
MGKSVKAPEAQLLEAGQLLDAYGGLLTERQRRFMRLHYEDDLSFSEIAREYDISRQAVHDSVKHAFRSLREIEDTLGLVQKNNAHAADSVPGHIGGRQLIERLKALSERVQKEPGSGHLTWLVDELDDLVNLLEGHARQETGQTE